MLPVLGCVCLGSSSVKKKNFSYIRVRKIAKNSFSWPPFRENRFSRVYVQKNTACFVVRICISPSVADGVDSS